MSQDLTRLTAAEIAAAVCSGNIAALDVTQSYLDRIQSLNPSLAVYLDVWDDAARDRASEIDKQVAAGENPGPLAGVTVALKDNMCTQQGSTTCGSRILENFRSPYDAGVVERLLAAGAVILGKLNMDEFAMGSSTENSAFHPTRNPWDTERVPGGSSGGAAACVAARMSAITLGSDTGGSIRQPAAYCGCIGMKPTYGRVSRYGLVAFASSLDQIGPLARNTGDLALALEVISGRDVRDSTSIDVSVPDFSATLSEGVDGLTIGLPKEYFADALDAEIRAKVDAAVDNLRTLGAKTVEVSLPHTEYAVATYYIIANAEASANLARFDGVRYGFRHPDATDVAEMYALTKTEGFGDEVQRRIMLGTYVLSSGYYDAYYLKAQKVRSLIRQDFQKVFESCDVLATPTAPTTAFRLGEKVADPLEMYLSDIYTVSANLAGIPAVSIPCGVSSENLPVGLQILAPALREDMLIRVSNAYEGVRECDMNPDEIEVADS